ncbi:MAG: CDP-alcohol phosphatidyltransferase family protein [Bacteroidales bacterium]|nr:CDP-alcohol phosphatidyltransferase family protein [Bacteroidales bacterium]
MREIFLLKQRIPLTIPNILSLYRMFMFPVIVLMIILKQEMVYAILVVISLNTDVWDGWIARRFNQQTAIGARIDSLADIGVYITALSGITIFKIGEIGPDAWLFYFFVASYVVTHLSPLIKFGKIQSFHLWSIKLGGYLQGIFFILLFFVDYVPIYFYVMVNISLLAFIESLTIQLIIPEMRSDVKGLYWVLKERRKQHA